jgi:hypothetical protein
MTIMLTSKKVAAYCETKNKRDDQHKHDKTPPIQKKQQKCSSPDRPLFINVSTSPYSHYIILT